MEIHDNFVINPEATKMQVFCLDAYQKSPAVRCVSKEACSLSRALHCPAVCQEPCILSSKPRTLPKESVTCPLDVPEKIRKEPKRSVRVDRHRQALRNESKHINESKHTHAKRSFLFVLEDLTFSTPFSFPTNPPSLPAHAPTHSTRLSRT